MKYGNILKFPEEIRKDLKISRDFRKISGFNRRFRDLLEICQDLSIYTGFRDLGKIFRICSRLYEISIGVIPLGHNRMGVVQTDFGRLKLLFCR